MALDPIDPFQTAPPNWIVEGFFVVAAVLIASIFVLEIMKRICKWAASHFKEGKANNG